MYSWPWKYKVSKRLLLCPPTFFFQDTSDCFLGLFSRNNQFSHWADSHGGCRAIFMLYTIFVSKSLCLNRPDVSKRQPWNKWSEVSESWSFPKVTNERQMENVGLKQVRSSCVHLIENIDCSTSKPNKIWNFLIKQNQETVTIFRMSLNVTVSITWYTGTFSIYLNGLQCSNKICCNFYPKLLLLPCIQDGNSCPSWPSISRANAAAFPVTRLLLSFFSAFSSCLLWNWVFSEFLYMYLSVVFSL